MTVRGPEYINSSAKRRLDVAGGIALGAFLLPVTATATGLSAVDTRSLNPFFTQERRTGGGHDFTTVKLRTIKRELSDPEFVTLGTFDPRASRVGLFLRQSGLDEWPQFLNVVRGSMSLVGPRPLVESDIDRRQSVDGILFDDWYEFYCRAKPGITGESQILRHHYRVNTDELLKQSMVLDLEYNETASLATDLRVLASTPLRMALANMHPVDDVTGTMTA